jgi:hypothetical protein
VPPLGLSSGTRLFEREDAARALQDVLLPTTGLITTPVLDQCFGTGKTSLVWQFRQILAATGEADADEHVDTERKQKLNDAIYLSVRFIAEDALIAPSSVVGDAEFKQKAEAVVCNALLRTLNQASSCALASVATVEELIQLTPALRNGQKFLFHIDEVGSFETLLDLERGRKMLQSIWSAAELLRHRGHFFVLSGRSRYLHLIGRQFNRIANFESPNTTVLIPLNNLSSKSIKSVFQEKACHDWITKEGHLEAMQILTGGVPRAVASAAEYAKTNATALPSESGLKHHVQTSCPLLFEDYDDNSFRHLVEIAWAGIEVNLDALYEGNEPLSAILTRFGLNTSAGSRSTRRCIEVPLYLLRSQRWAAGSLRNIVQYSEPGDRLETGFRRVLFLRLSVLEVSNWEGIALDYLDSIGVPFPSVKDDMMKIFNFPKLSGSAHGSTNSAQEFMQLAHRQCDENIVLDPDRKGITKQRQTFSKVWLKQLSELMQVGHFYVPLPRSSSADAMIRLGEKTKLDLQFKNFMNAITKPEMVKEAELCAIEGWTVFLVIFCSKGHSANKDGSDLIFTHKGVTIVALSQNSVSNFLGPKLLENAESSGLATDQINRLSACASPLKRKFQQ